MNKFILAAFFLVIALVSNVQAGPSESIVKVLAGSQAGTGFVWQSQSKQKYIVTSLHTLAGASTIFYDRASSGTQLIVAHTDEEADLALLVPVEGSIPLPALKLINAEPKSGEQYVIWGFPAGVKIVQGDSIEFSLGPQLVSLKSLLPSDILKDITASGFPKSTLNILRVSSGITPGHSGAPIMVKGTDHVIGIGAGGLSMLGFRRVNWAVPAETYLEKIAAKELSSDNVASLPSNHETKYQFSVAASADEDQGAAELDETSAVKTDTSQYYRIYQVPFSDLLASFSSGDEGVLNEEQVTEIYEQADDLDYSPEQAQIDVYQNSETGAMIFLPAGTELTSQGELLIARTANQRVQMTVQIVETDSYVQAQEVKDRFVNNIETEYGTDWYADADSDSRPYHDSELGYWVQWIMRYQAADDEVSAENEYTLSLSIVYDDAEGYGDFLGVAVLGQGFSDYEIEDDVLLHQMDVCAILAGFIPY